ncbi:MAG: hypothetical protein ACTSRW_00930 [Candidatus Helarchaeota archaeon]
MSVTVLNFNQILDDWDVFESILLELNDFDSVIEVKQISHPEDFLSIERINDNGYKLTTSFTILILSEYQSLIQNARLALLHELGFVLDDDVKFSQESKAIWLKCQKIVKTPEEAISTLQDLGKRLRSFRVMVEFKEGATYFYSDGMLREMFPGLEMGKHPQNHLVKSIVDTLIESYIKDFRQGVPEFDCGKRVAARLVEDLEKHEKMKSAKERISWYPEKLYRMLREDKKLKKYERISNELYEFISIVPYTGPGKRKEGATCGMAYQIKKENKYIMTKLKESGINLRIIFPGG